LQQTHYALTETQPYGRAMVPTDPLKLHRELLYEMHSRLVAHLNGAQEPTANDRDSQASDTLDLQAEEPDE